jgi:hypothetical protein
MAFGFSFLISLYAFIHEKGFTLFMIRFILSLCSKGMVLEESNCVLPGKNTSLDKAIYKK